MPPVVPDPRTIRAFETSEAFSDWLSTHHDVETELYLRIYKKGSGTPSITYAEALDVALCWGWIDGIKKSHDAQSFLQRFTPRKPKSIWSQNNQAHVARLIADGRMTPHGLAHVEAAKSDGRWQAAYAPASTMRVPDELLRAIEASPKAAATFATLNKQNLYALAFRLASVKTEAGRARRVASFVAMLERGETPHPNGKAK